MNRRQFVSMVGITSLAGCAGPSIEEQREEQEQVENGEPPTIVEVGHKYDPDLQFRSITGGIVVHVDIRNNQELDILVEGEIVLFDGETNLGDVSVILHVEAGETVREYDHIAATETVASDVTDVVFRDMTYHHY